MDQRSAFPMLFDGLPEEHEGISHMGIWERKRVNGPLAELTSVI